MDNGHDAATTPALKLLRLFLPTSMSTWSQIFVRKPTFSTADIPTLEGKVMLVTGGYSGIGLETVRVLLEHGAKVYMTGRDRGKAEHAMAAMKELGEKSKGEVAFIEMDLADLASVKRGAGEFLALRARLDVLFNNAGVMQPPISEFTAQGYDLQFGTNVLAHFYLTTLLLPALLAGATHSADSKARVVNTASLGSTFVKQIDYGTLRLSESDSELQARKICRLANVVLSAELARRYGEKGIVSTSLNPGNIKTNIARHWMSFGLKITKLLGHLIVYPPRMGALTQLYAGTATEGAELNGKYLIPWARIGTPHPASQDEEIGRELWMWLDEQVHAI
ncbi:NAD(P)-binding protein [Mycena kentingensis (nom. inval.)]|nr:NAD(P)-binding protein [Mycena kentingensis (nom. inval.)]